MENIKLYVAIPCYGCLINNATLISILNLQNECIKNNIEVCFDIPGNESLITRARNLLTARFLNTDYTHLLFIDSDIVFSPEAVFKLLKFDKPLSSCVYAKKNFDWSLIEQKIKNGDKEPISQAGIDWNLNLKNESQDMRTDFVEVLDTATGFMMVKRHVFEEMIMHFPELRTKNDIQNEKLEYYYDLFECTIDPHDLRYLSEDYSFCRKWQSLGGQIFADISSELGHIGSYTYTGNISTKSLP